MIELDRANFFSIGSDNCSLLRVCVCKEASINSAISTVINTVQTGDEKQREREGLKGEWLKGQMKATKELGQNEM